MAVLYAPKDDDPSFFLNFFDHLNYFKCDEVIIGGDFNLVLDLDIDKKGGLTKAHTESEENLHNITTNYETFTDSFLKARQPNRLAYKIIVREKAGKNGRSSKKMDHGLQSRHRVETQENTDWDTGYRSFFLCTKISKLIVFQFKLLHRRLVTNSFLTKINLKDNEQCTFCQNDMETLIHLFWTCNVSPLF